MKKLLSLFLVLSLFATNSYALFNKELVGTTVFPFLKVAIDAKNVGMGEVGAAFVNDASAMYWNVAGIADVENMSVMATYNKWFIDSTQGYLGVVKTMPFGSLGFALDYLYVGDIEGYNTSGAPTGRYSYNNYAVNLGYAKKIDRIYAGILVKYVNHRMKSLNESGFAADVGVIYSRVINDNISAGLTVQNIGPSVNGQKMPLNIKLGCAGVLLKGNKLLWALDLNLPIDNTPNVHMGIQYALNQLLALRLGFRSNREDLGTLAGLSAGFGVNLNNYSFDMSYSPYEDIASLGGAIRVSAKVNF